MKSIGRLLLPLFLGLSLLFVLCAPDSRAAEACPPGKVQGPKGDCVVPPTCGPTQVLVLNRCLEKCLDGSSPNVDGKCPKVCPQGKVFNAKGECVPIPTCGPTQVLVLNRCFEKCPDGSSPSISGRCSGAH